MTTRMTSQHSKPVVLLCNLLIRRARSDAAGGIDRQLSSRDLVAVLIARCVDAMRGAMLLGRMVRVRQPCFVGRGVRIIGGSHVALGRGCVIRDHVVIDAISRNGVRLGDGVTIDQFSTLRCTGTLRELGEGISIGDNSAIGAYSFLGGSGKLRIGKNVLGGQRLSFHPENHRFESVDEPIRTQGTTRRGIVIGDDCWLGTGSVFLDGVTVGRGSVIAAGSVVNTDIPEYSVAAGVPAKVVRSRLG